MHRIGYLIALLALTPALVWAQKDWPEKPVYQDPVFQGVQEVIDQLCRQHDSRLASLGSESQLVATAAEIRERLLKMLELDLDTPRLPPPATPTGTIDAADYRIEKLVLETSPGVPMPCTLYVPKGGPLRKPVIFSPPGHGGRDGPAEQNAYQRFARAGFIVLAKDGWGKQERRRTGHVNEGGQLALTGDSLMALELWDNVRAIDYLLNRPDVDRERLGITAVSGGGTQTLYTTVIDRRIQAASPTCAVTTFCSDLANTTMCVCELLPNILGLADHGGFLAAAYPRPWLVVNAESDEIFPIAGARAAARQARQLYALGGKANRVDAAEYPVKHCWDDAMVTRQIHWFRAQFGLPPLVNPPAADGFRAYGLLGSYRDGEVPPGSLDLTGIARRQMRAFGLEKPTSSSGRSISQDSQWLAELIGSLWSGKPTPPAGLRRQEMASDPLQRVRRWQLQWKSGLGGKVGMQVTRPLHSAGRERLVIHLDRQRRMEPFEHLYWEDRLHGHAIIAELDYTGKSLRADEEGEISTALLAAGRSLLAERVRDLLVALDVLRSEHFLEPATEVVFVAHGFDGVLLLAAAPMLPAHSALVLDRTPVSYLAGSEIRFPGGAMAAPLHWTILPGIARRCDLSDLLELAAPRRVWLLHPLDAAAEALSEREMARVLKRLDRTDRAHLTVLSKEVPRAEMLRQLNRLVTVED